MGGVRESRRCNGGGIRAARRYICRFIVVRFSFAPNPIIAVNNWVWCGEGAWVFKRCEKRMEFPHLFATFAVVGR